MKLYEQLCFDLLKEYQTPGTPTTLKPKTLAVTEILKKANVTDQNILKAITDILEKEDESSSNTPSPSTQQTTQTNGNVIPNKDNSTGIKP